MNFIVRKMLIDSAICNVPLAYGEITNTVGLDPGDRRKLSKILEELPRYEDFRHRRPMLSFSRILLCPLCL